MTTFTKLLLSAVCIILFSSISSLGQSAYPNSGVIKLTFDDLFPPSNQNTMGLNKLTPLEKEILRKHVENLLITAFRVGAQQSPPLEEQLRQGSGIVPQGSVIESKIDGEFEGWEGDTIFKMMNGQIWQQ